MQEILLMVIVGWSVVGLTFWLGHLVGGGPKDRQKSESVEPKPAQPEAIAPAPEQAQ
jgi:hypothetical protein